MAVSAELSLARILIADDEPQNATLVRRLLEREGFVELAAVTDSAAVLPTYETLRPDLVILDLRMPGLDGFDLLRLLRERVPEPSHLPILVLTGDDAETARTRALSLGATDLVAKPFYPQELLLRVRNLLETRFLYLKLEDQTRWLEQQVAERTRALEQVHLEVCERLARAAEFRDDATGQHTRRVGVLAAALAERAGADADVQALIRRAAPLHDVGKIGIPDDILLKAATLSDVEFDVVKTHTTIGADILSGGQSPLMQMAEHIARSHHERWDGSGYPHGLTEDTIPWAARVVSIADFFDALTHARPYRDAWSVSRVVGAVAHGAGRQFDPVLVQAFLELPHAELV